MIIIKIINDAHVFKPNGSQPLYYFTSAALDSVVHSLLPETFFLPGHILWSIVPFASSSFSPWQLNIGVS